LGAIGFAEMIRLVIAATESKNNITTYLTITVAKNATNFAITKIYTATLTI